METIDLLKSNELFSNLGDAELKIVAELTKVRTIPRNTLLINEGDASDAMYLIKEGKVDVIVTNENGEQFVLSTLKQGDNFGELSLLDDHPRSASIITLEKSIFIVLHKADFLRLAAFAPWMLLLSHCMAVNVPEDYVSDVYFPATPGIASLTPATSMSWTTLSAPEKV